MSNTNQKSSESRTTSLTYTVSWQSAQVGFESNVVIICQAQPLSLSLTLSPSPRRLMRRNLYACMLTPCFTNFLVYPFSGRWADDQGKCSLTTCGSFLSSLMISKDHCMEVVFSYGSKMDGSFIRSTKTSPSPPLPQQQYFFRIGPVSGWAPSFPWSLISINAPVKVASWVLQELQSCMTRSSTEKKKSLSTILVLFALFTSTLTTCLSLCFRFSMSTLVMNYMPEIVAFYSTMKA